MLLLPLVLYASSASAQFGGAWQVNGNVSDTAFILDCTFEPNGAEFGGTCVEEASGDPKVHAGKNHTLTAGTAAGDQVNWTYKSSFLFTTFDVSFSGTLDKDRIAGTVTAAGRKGAFTAVRK
jgi:hypothetical protein